MGRGDPVKRGEWGGEGRGRGTRSHNRAAPAYEASGEDHDSMDTDDEQDEEPFEVVNRALAHPPPLKPRHNNAFLLSSEWCAPHLQQTTFSVLLDAPADGGRFYSCREKGFKAAYKR
jgi:hypothetical protein